MASRIRMLSESHTYIPSARVMMRAVSSARLLKSVKGCRKCAESSAFHSAVVRAPASIAMTFLQALQWVRKGLKPDPDSLGFGIFVDRVERLVASDARLLVAAEGHRDVIGV